MHASQSQPGGPGHHHPPAFSKFNSLDRRALARRHHGGARITVGVDSSSSNSDQVKISPPQSLQQQPTAVIRTSMNGKIESSDNVKDSSRSGINISGLPEPLFPRPGSSTSVNNNKKSSNGSNNLYSSQESLSAKPFVRSNAGTPQTFQAQTSSGQTVISLTTGARTVGSRRPSGDKTSTFKSSNSNIYANMSEIRHQQQQQSDQPVRSSSSTFKPVNSSPYIMTSSGTAAADAAGSSSPPEVPSAVAATAINSRNTSGCFSAGSSGSSGAGGGGGGSSSSGGNNASPDSAVGGVVVGGCIDSSESMLKEKDNEIAYLRSTIEQNEQVIFTSTKVSAINVKCM